MRVHEHNKEGDIELAGLLKEISKSMGETQLVSVTPFFSLVRPHPIFLQKYRDISKNSNEKLGKILFKLLKALLRSLIFLSLSLMRRGYHNEGKSENNDFYLISHAFTDEDTCRETDLYFGPLKNILLDSGLKGKFIYLDHRNYFDRIKNRDNMIGDSIILGWRMSISYYKDLYLLALKELSELLKIFKKEKNIYKKNLIINGLLNIIEYGIINRIQIDQIKQVIQNSKTKYIIITFEGHSYERGIFKAVYDLSEKIIKIGYQHAPIFKGQISILSKQGLGYDPDVILTSGMYSNNYFEKFSCLINSKKIIIGSSKILKNETIKIENRNKKNLICIVLPEGIASEMERLFNFSLQCAKAHNDIEFIWRVHPSINDQYLAKIIGPIKLPKNIIISKNSLERDLKISNFAIYRGSGSIINAIKHSNIMPLYLSSSDELTIDPLHMYHNISRIISNIDDFKYAIDRYDEYIVKYSDIYVSLANEIYAPFNADELLTYLSTQDHD